MEPLISVIVPVYKVEPWLARCVSSIRNQTYRNLEIILVDDGSPDKCGPVSEKLYWKIIGIQRGLEPDPRGWCLFIDE